MSAELKPYLAEINSLYQKISAFEDEVNLRYSYNPVENMSCYINEDVDTVTEALSRILDISSDELDILKEKMHSGAIDFMRLKSEKETMPEDEFQLLYIISRPFFRSMKGSMNMDNMFWQDGRCPVCNAVPSLSVIERESQRKYFCSFCGSRGTYLRIGCPACLTSDPQDITIITLEGEEGMRADTCEKCKSYYKTFEGSMTADRSIDSLDIISIPLDIVVQEKGFKRHSPNPVGIIRTGS